MTKMDNKKTVDEMLDDVAKGKMDSTPMNEFDRMAKDAEVEDLTKFAKESKKVEEPTFKKPAQNVDSRYAYFQQSLDNIEFNQHLSKAFRTGFEEALDRYIGKVDLNKNNLSIVDKMIAQELIMCGQRGSQLGKLKGFTNPLERQGYYDGLKQIESLLESSKSAMMRKVSNEVLEALDKE